MTTTNTSNSHMYTILDAARIFGEIDTAQELQTNFLSLYQGQSEDLLSSVAPYLFTYQSSSEFGKWLFHKGWGNSWGIFVNAEISLDDLRKHFRKFLLVKTEDGKELYFRFYDPRVLRIFLPTCNEQQLLDFFGPINSFQMESEDAEYVVEFKLENGQLVTHNIPKIDFWSKMGVAEAYQIPPNVVKMDDKKSEPEVVEVKKEEPPRKWNFLIE